MMTGDGKLRLAAALALLCSSLGPACAYRASSASGGEVTPSGVMATGHVSDGPPLEQVDWSGPFHGQGVPVSPSELAAAGTSFPLYTPGDFGGTTRIIVTPGEPTHGYDAVFFVTQHPFYGAVWIGESAPDIASEAERLAGYEDTASQDGNPEIHTQAKLVMIGGSVPALLGISQDGICTLQWVERGTQFFILGPTLSRTQVLDIADSI